MSFSPTSSAAAVTQAIASSAHVIQGVSAGRVDVAGTLAALGATFLPAPPPAPAPTSATSASAPTGDYATIRPRLRSSPHAFSAAREAVPRTARDPASSADRCAAVLARHAVGAARALDTLAAKALRSRPGATKRPRPRRRRSHRSHAPVLSRSVRAARRKADRDTACGHEQHHRDASSGRRAAARSASSAASSGGPAHRRRARRAMRPRGSNASSGAVAHPPRGRDSCPGATTSP